MGLRRGRRALTTPALRALLSGVVLTEDGKAEASMGVDAGDFNNDGDEDLVMTRRARAGGSYASANDPRVLMGLGDSAEAPRVRVSWAEWPRGVVIRRDPRSIHDAERRQRPVRGRAALAGLATAASVLAILAGGCTPNEKATPAPAIDRSIQRPPEAQTLRPVSLPDVSLMTESPVREQMRERYSSLRQKIQNPSTPAVELSNAYGEVGKLLMAAAEHLEVAESCFLHAQALVPGEQRWPYYLAQLYRTQGDLVKSAAFFEQALQLRPDDVATLVWLGDVRLAQGQPEAAEPLFAKALSLQPRSASARLGLGRAALVRKDYVRAVQHLEDVLALGPQGASVHYPLAMAYRSLGEPGKAEAHLRQRGDIEVVPADPLMQELRELLESSVAYELRGTQALNKGDWAAAAAYFRKGLELAPASPSLRHKLGTALFQMGDTRGAVAQFEEVVRVSPDYAKADYSLGVIMEASGRTNEAIERFSAAVRDDPSYVVARLSLAGLLRGSGRLRESLSEYEQVVKLDPRVAEGQFGYAMALVGLRRYQEARDRLTNGMKAHPDQPTFAHALARLLAATPDDRVRDGRRAMAVMQALSGEQKRIDFGETMAMTFAEVGQYEEATAWQRGAMATAKRVGRDDLEQRMAENLRLYEGRKPCRTPWRNGELP